MELCAFFTVKRDLICYFLLQVFVKLSVFWNRFVGFECQLVVVAVVWKKSTNPSIIIILKEEFVQEVELILEKWNINFLYTLQVEVLGFWSWIETGFVNKTSCFA